MHCTFFIDLYLFDLTIPIVLTAIISMIYMIIDFQSGVLLFINELLGIELNILYRLCTFWERLLQITRGRFGFIKSF